MTVDIYLAAAGGVATSILLPVLSKAVRAEFSIVEAAATPKQRTPLWIRALKAAWPYLRKYLLLFFFSLLTAALLIFYLGDQISTVAAAFVAGYAADSTIQKIAQRP